MLKAISPIDGRYATKTIDLANYFSEYALIKYRVLVEVEYFISLTQLGLKPLNGFPKDRIEDLRKIISSFDENDARNVKDIEAKTNHDVKAVEYFLKIKLDQLGLSKYGEMIHFGLTSQDVNNTAIPLSMKDGIESCYSPLINATKEALQKLAKEWTHISLLSHTHGQPASPTSLGKEIYVFAERINGQLISVINGQYFAKFGGAVGNLNAHKVTFPEIDWILFSNEFIEGLGMRRLQYTTQIDHYDYLAAQLQNVKRINTILIDLCRDIWTYISKGYFLQKTKEGEVGSSTMPHKVNPIDFENAEGNLGIANAIFTFLIDKLPISRLQRDLTDSTVLRNLGVPLAHTIIAMKSILKGLAKLEVNHSKIEVDLEQNWAVVSEAYQTILRREGIEKPYELLKEITRGKSALRKEDLQNFVRGLEIPNEVKEEMLAISPHNYLGYVDLP